MGKRQASECVVKLENAAVIRGGRLVLQNLSLEARSGDIIWLRGANGSGKSTLLRAVAGLLPLAAGRRTIEGGIAMTDENLALDTSLPLEKALAFWARLDGSDAERQQEAFAKFDLTGLTDIPVSYMSSGQRKRAALARTLATDCDIWLLDEPYNALDGANAARLDECLLRHAEGGGVAIVAAHRPARINVADTISLDRPSREAA